MAKSPEAFRTISEVAEWLGLQAHVLRFWESKFSQVKPVKRAGGRRYYRPADMLLLGGIKKLLHDDGMTIKGVQKTLREHGISYVADHSPSLDDLTMAQLDDEVAAVSPEERSTILPFEPPSADQKPSEAAPKVPTVDEVLEASVARTAPIVENTAAPVPQDSPVAEEAATSEEDVPDIEPMMARPEVVSATPEAIAQEEPAQAIPEPATVDALDPAPAQESASEPDLDLEPQLEFISERDPEPKPEPKAEPETNDAALPSFLRRNIEAPTTKVPLIIDAPDAPPEDQIEVPPGLLARLTALESIPASQVEKMRNAHAQLEALHARLSGTGKE